MFNKKEKDIKKYLINEDIELTKQDEEDILNKIVSKTNLVVEEKPSLKRKFNLKIIYALACSLVICLLGFVGYELLGQGQFIDPNYKFKNVDELNLSEGEYCLAYRRNITNSETKYLEIEFNVKISLEKKNNVYLISSNSEYILYVKNDSVIDKYNITLSMVSSEIIDLYNNTYNTNFTIDVLNSNNDGLLFSVLENGIEFYTIDDIDKYPILVEF